MHSLIVKAPFPYFGGKSRISPLIWKHLGNIPNYIEPFAGSLAVLLSNPNKPKIETVNDKDCFVSNFWRAVSSDPEGVAKFADYPVNQIDLHARHKWLVSNATDDFRSKMLNDPLYYDLKIAGWWVWGIGASIGNNWLHPKGLNSAPLLSSAGGGIHGLSNNILDWFKKIQERTRRVRVCSDDWKKVVTPSVTFNNVGLGKNDITGVFLDPPYDYKGRDKVYKEESNVFSDTCAWAIQNGDNPKMRIVLCGYESDIVFPDNWTAHEWETQGGMANLGDSRGRNNSKKERVWISPHCIK